MTYDGKDPFESLMSSTFSPEEQIDLDLAALAPHIFQPILPGRSELLEHFDELLGQIVTVADAKVAQAYIDRFLDNLVTVVDLALGTTVKVQQVSSIMTAKQTGGLEWSVTGPNTDLFGDFAAILVGPWYDIPYGLRPTDNSIYKRPHGLQVIFNNARLACNDVPVAAIADDCAIVTLNYGKPELFRVLPSTS